MKKTGLLLLALIGLILIYLAVVSRTPVAKTDTPFIEADSASVSYMKIVTPSDSVELRKEGDGWMVALAGKVYPANKKNVGNALQKFAQMTRKAIISTKSERQAEFEVDASKGVRVVVKQGDKESSIVLGKASPTMQTSYARLADSDEIWEIGGNNGPMFKRGAADWRDKTICEMAMDSIRRVTWSYLDQKLQIAKQDTMWTGSENGAAFTPFRSNVERVTRMLSRMNAVEFMDNPSDTLFAAPVCVMQVEKTDGSTFDLMLTKKDDKQYYLRKSGALSDFVIYNATAEALLKKKDDLIEKAKPAS